MQTSVPEPLTLEPGLVPAMTDVERVSALLQGRSTDPPAALRSARSLEARLERLKKRTSLLNQVELSEPLRAILKRTTNE